MSIVGRCRVAGSNIRHPERPVLGLPFLGVLRVLAVNPSGQRQRLAMARALLHDTPIYLFDEATSNVDAESENDIMQAIHSLAGKKTIILISHRLANVVHSDCIYAMSNGRVMEQGTHAELLAQQGAYSRLYLAQRQLETLEEEDA